MSESKTSGFCKDCGKNAVLYRKSANHILHLLLSVFTLGVWLPIWFLISFQFGGWRCVNCGSKRTGQPRKVARV